MSALGGPSSGNGLRPKFTREPEAGAAAGISEPRGTPPYGKGCALGSHQRLAIRRENAAKSLRTLAAAFASIAR